MRASNVVQIDFGPHCMRVNAFVTKTISGKFFREPQFFSQLNDKVRGIA